MIANGWMLVGPLAQNIMRFFLCWLYILMHQNWQAMVDVAREVGADAVSHGCTGKGNDQACFRIFLNIPLLLSLFLCLPI